MRSCSTQMLVEAFVSAASARMTEGKERKKEFGGETPTDARSSSAAPCGCGRCPHPHPPPLAGREWEGAAHLSAFHRGSRPKESFIARDAASGHASWDVAGTRFAHPFERALPAPACPSPATHLALRS